ncbi:viral aspartic protease [Halodurantibacterium flavum]|uniref:Viral aspartic protease n=1 Tax=Halodurantibacterium flavum TaxID=1382802 RepID=A0ABW4S6B7_9RHOB
MTRSGLICSATALLVLAACGGGGTGGGTSEPLPDGRPIETTRFQFYKNDHNSRNRIRRELATDDEDRLVLQQFDSNQTRPEQYKNLLAASNIVNQTTMNLEVVAEIEIVDEKETVLRVLRLTADQERFSPVPVDQLGDANGRFFFRGQTEVYTTLADGSFVRSRGELVNLRLDFRDETALIDLRTDTTYGTGDNKVDQLRTEIDAELPFNVRTGVFGGQISMIAYLGESATPTAVTGELRGNVHATQHMLRQDVEGLTTSGLYSVGGAAGDPLRADGIFWGRHPNR